MQKIILQVLAVSCPQYFEAVFSLTFQMIDVTFPCHLFLNPKQLNFAIARVLCNPGSNFVDENFEAYIWTIASNTGNVPLYFQDMELQFYRKVQSAEE